MCLRFFVTLVITLVDSQHVIQIETNRANLKHLMETVLFLAKRGIAFRGHTENDES